MKQYVAAILMVLAGSSAMADEVVKKPVDVADTPEKLQAAIDSIHAEMATGQRYEYIRPDQRHEVDDDFATMSALVKNAGSVSAMKEADRVKLFNAQEHANGLLTHSDRNRLVCERRAQMGSHLPVNQCRTVADIERERAGSQKVMQDHSIDRNTTAAQFSSSKLNQAGNGSH
jgi:hypothetical protein